VEFTACHWDDRSTSRDTTAIRKSLAEAAEVEIGQVIVSASVDGVVRYMIDPIPDTRASCDSIQEKLKSAGLAGFFQSTLVSQGFSCSDKIQENVKFPAVVDQSPIDFTAKLLVVDNLQKLLVALFDQDTGLHHDVLNDLRAVNDMVDVLSSLKNDLGIAVRRDIGDVGLMMQEKELIGTLSELITLLLNYLRTNQLNIDDLNLTKHAAAFPTNDDRISAARAASKCERQHPNDPVGPGCETTHMALSSLPLRELDPDRFDPVLQREIAIGLPATSGVQGGPQQPPGSPSVDHVAYSADKLDDFWMLNDSGIFQMPEGH
jgi:hypothetical protein